MTLGPFRITISVDNLDNYLLKTYRVGLKLYMSLF